MNEQDTAFWSWKLFKVALLIGVLGYVLVAWLRRPATSAV